MSKYTVEFTQPTSILVEASLVVALINWFQDYANSSAIWSFASVSERERLAPGGNLLVENIDYTNGNGAREWMSAIQSMEPDGAASRYSASMIATNGDYSFIISNIVPQMVRGNVTMFVMRAPKITQKEKATGNDQLELLRTLAEEITHIKSEQRSDEYNNIVLDKVVVVLNEISEHCCSLLKWEASDASKYQIYLSIEEEFMTIRVHKSGCISIWKDRDMVASNCELDVVKSVIVKHVLLRLTEIRSKLKAE
jgi:hypothetical protein